MENNEYSWTILEWWNHNWSYWRIQYSSRQLVDNIWELSDLFELWLYYLNSSNNKSRLDMRFIISKWIFSELKILEQDFWSMDISIKQFDKKSDVLHLILWKNTQERELDIKEINKIKEYINKKINDTLNYIDSMEWFENFCMYHLDVVKNKKYRFEKNNFDVSEIYNLWWNNFWWEEHDILILLERLDDKNNCIYWLRDENGRLISIVLIIDWETTEWATLAELQWHKIIESLLIFANSDQIEKKSREKLELYVHARYDRSISPAIKSWMVFNLNSPYRNLLTNLVEVEWDMQTFVEWVLDTSKYTDEIINSYLSYFLNN